MAASRSDFPADSRRAVGHAHQATPMLTLFFSFFFFIYWSDTSSNVLFVLNICIYIFLVYDAFQVSI